MFKGVGLRAQANEILDWFRFKVDLFPTADYQPLPWLGVERARRGDGVESRWRQIERVVKELDVKSAVDIGCNVGYFVIALSLINVPTVGIESNPKYYRPLLYAIRKLRLANGGLLAMTVSPATMSLVPRADCIIFLSVWHHIVKEYGLESASQQLSEVWDHAGRVMFFETGESEMPVEYRLPKFEAPDDIAEFLRTTCIGSQVRHLGAHDAFDPSGNRVARNLFAVVRIA